MRVRIALARAAGALSRRTGRGGTSLPGKLLLRLAPDAIARLSRGLRDGSAVVSATNGKTTTAAMVAAILEQRGVRLVHNRTGANMAGGVASALLDARGQGDLGLFEVDEFWLGAVTEQLRPRALLLANLFRDQLDRYGELETIAERWQEVVSASAAAGTRLVLNADDPLVADLGRDLDPVLFGVQDTSLALAGLQHAADSKHCRRCGRPYVYDAVLLGHLGHYHCPTGDAARPDPHVFARDVQLHGVRDAAFTLVTPEGERRISLPLPGLYNVYNALAAAALAGVLGASLDDVAAGLGAVAPAFGRAETVALGEPADDAAADQEPGGRQRGAAHAAAGGRRARRARRAQRPHRRRARRLLGVGRRLRAAGRPGAPGDLRGHARGRAGRAPQVRGGARRAHPRRA